jgi:glycosyltransferase involved in cell wall biosynthesis
MAEARPSDTPLQVIVPAYGTSPLLTDTLASLVDVVPADVPLVVLDDASPGDDVRRQAAPFAPRVEYWRNERNLGVSGAFNAAMRRADAEYVVLVGPDDRAVPEFAQTYLAAIEQYRGAAALHPDVDTIDEHGRPWVSTGDKVKRLLRPPAGQLRGQQLAARLLIGNWTYNPAIAWRVSFVREHPFNEQLHTAMDLDLLLRLAFAGETLALVDGRALEYRRHAGAVSSINAGRKRLTEELEIHAGARREASSRHWRRTALAGRLAPTARLHGLLLASGRRGQERWATVRLALTGRG